MDHQAFAAYIQFSCMGVLVLNRENRGQALPMGEHVPPSQLCAWGVPSKSIPSFLINEGFKTKTN